MVKRIAYLYEGREANYFNNIKHLFAGNALGTIPLPKELKYSQVVMSLAKNRIDYVFFSSPRFLGLLLRKMYADTNYKAGKNMDVYKPYWGATFVIGDMTFICMPELETVHKMSYGKFLFKRYVEKILNETDYITTPKMTWHEVRTHGLGNQFLKRWKEKAVLIALDIETAPFRVTPEFAQSKLGFGLVAKHTNKTKTDPVRYIAQVITCVGYTALLKDEDGTYHTETIVVPYEGEDCYNLINSFNQLEAPKVMQNGKYDVIHLTTNNLPVRNWRYDTYGMMHSLYAELPRTLEFIAGFTLRNYMYWKDESGGNLFEYNAKDTFQTLWACVALLQEFPQYAVNNFSENFIQVFPCVTCSLEGFAVNWSEFGKKKDTLHHKSIEVRNVAEDVFGEGFNPNSPVQVKKLIQLFGMPAAESSDKKTMQKFADLSEWHARLISYVINFRQASKVHSTYFEFPFLGDRWLYDLDPFGTETCRYASKASSLWVGQQGQNFPMIARSPYIPDPSYTLGASDNEQSESRCTAYISEDENLINTVETSEDFHKTNASLFFGLDFKDITKDIRTLSKRVNHGANYNMGINVLIESMGTKNIIKAKMLLKLPQHYGLKETARYLLDSFDKTYPDIKGKYYPEVIKEIATTNKLVGATGWTRYCFGDPSKSKVTLNSYVAHAPQSLSVKIINRAFFKIWHKLQFKEKVIRLKMQKHDEIIWQNLPKDDWVGEVISEIMAEPTEVRGRSMVIPNEPEVGKANWGEIG